MAEKLAEEGKDMKIFRKLAAIISAAAISVAACSITAGADSIYDTAKAVDSGKSVSTKLPYFYDTADYKITTSETGTLTLGIESHMPSVRVYVYDADGNKLSTAENTTTTGSCSSAGKTDHDVKWNDAAEKYSGTVSYSVGKGTYYIRFYRNSSGTYGTGEIKFTANYPSLNSTAKLNCITVNMERGDSLSLGADMTGTGTVTWKSSKPKVAAVSKTGKVTAKSKGTTVISAKCGNTTKKIKIKVS